MTLTPTQKYYLARFLSDKYDVSLETVEDRIKDPDVDDWEDFEFVEDRLHFHHTKVIAEFDEEFLAREQYFKDLVKTYLQKTPKIRNYLNPIQITSEKEQELSIGTTQIWYTDEQLVIITDELLEALSWLEDNIDLNDFPEKYESVYRFNLALMRYGLEKSMNRTRVDFLNPYHTFRSKLHTNGAVGEDKEGLYYSSLHSRLEQVMDVDELESTDEQADYVVEELIEYYTGSPRELVQVTESILETPSD